MRRSIAERLGESYRNAVHVTASRTIDAEALLTTVAEVRSEGHEHVSLLDLLIAALSETLDAHPEFNATFEDETHTLYEEQNVGIAVDVEQGLLTPVIADVGSKSVDEIAAERRQLTERMQAGDYTMSDLRNGTFTVSNLGPLGVDSFTPVINPPEVAILGIGRLRERARPVDSDSSATDEAVDHVTFRKELTVDLSFDHRIVDGADAARLLATLAEHTEAAEGLPNW